MNTWKAKRSRRVRNGGRVLGAALLQVALAGPLAGCDLSEDPRVACAAKVERFRTRVGSFDSHPSRSMFTDDLSELPRLDLQDPVRPEEPGPILTFRGPNVMVEGALVGQVTSPDRSRVADTLAQLKRNWMALHPNEEPRTAPLYVLASADLPAVDVLRWLTPPYDGYGPELLVRTGEESRSPLAPPGASDDVRRLAEDLEAAGSMQRFELVARTTREAMAHCDEYISLAASIAGADASRKARILQEGFPSVVEACACDRVDVDVAEVLAAVLLSPGGPPVAALPLELAADPEREALSIGATMTVADLAALLARAGDRAGTLRLALPDPAPEEAAPLESSP